MKKKNKIILFNIILVIVLAILLLISYYELSIANNKIGALSTKSFISASIILSCISLIISNIIFIKKEISTSKIFICVVPITCLIFMFVMPMFRSHDELRHWLKAYEISEGTLVSKVIDGEVQSELPAAVANGVNKYWRNIKYSDVLKSMKNELDKNDKKLHSMKEVALYSPVQYLPQSLGISVTKLFTNKVMYMAYMARFFNMIFCLMLVYLAIKITPIGKKTILLISLFPLSIEAFSSMSPDGMTIGIILLFIAYVLKLKFGDELVKKKDIVILTILSIGIALCKIVYIPIVLLMLIVPKEKFKESKYKYITLIPIIIISFFINLLWLKIANSFLTLSSAGDSSNKVTQILKNPIKYLQTVLYTINYYGDSYVNTLFGSVLAWGEYVKLYYIVPFTFGMLFLFDSTTSKSLKNKFNKFDIILIVCICIVIVGLIFTSLYVQWTDANESNTIQGVQGRYFIPIMFLVAIILSNMKINTEYKEENITKAIGILGIILQVYIMLSIMIIHM